MSTGHRTEHRFFLEGDRGRAAPHRVSRPVSCFFKNVFFVDFNLARNEAPERGGREELLLESQEVQELSVGAPASQLVLNMSSEDQTVDHTYMLMGNDHDTIFIDFSEYTGQTLKIVLKGPMTVHRPRTRCVHFKNTDM